MQRRMNPGTVARHPRRQHPGAGTLARARRVGCGSTMEQDVITMAWMARNMHQMLLGLMALAEMEVQAHA
jgi:hypothetical protein